MFIFFLHVLNFSVLSLPIQLLRESIAEHKPHIDKLLKIGPQLAELSLQEGALVTQRYTDAERRYLAIKEGVKGRATTLDEAVSQSAQVHQRGRLINCLMLDLGNCVLTADLGIIHFII